MANTVKCLKCNQRRTSTETKVLVDWAMASCPKCEGKVDVLYVFMGKEYTADQMTADGIYNQWLRCRTEEAMKLYKIQSAAVMAGASAEEALKLTL